MKYKKVYIISPLSFVSGGADALHQMAYYLNQLHIDASMAYYSYEKIDAGKVNIPAPFKEYINSFLLYDDIVDEKDVAIVIPEIYAYLSKEFKCADTYIWWLGIGGYASVNKKSILLLSLPLRIIRHWDRYKINPIFIVKESLKYSFIFEKKNAHHLCASYYTFDFVSKKSKKEVQKCIEPISKFFINEYDKIKDVIDDEKRQDLILYNPKRCEAYVQKLINYNPDLKFIPLQNLTQEQLIQKYLTAKLYIDFGPFPGAERIPKEAVLFGCNILTGQHGASNYHGDVPIPSKYKMNEEKTSIDEISAIIRWMLNQYKEIYCDFDEYRTTVKNLELNFTNALQRIFTNDN